MKTKRPLKVKSADDQARRQVKAARHPEVVEFDTLLADAVTLGKRMRAWLARNDRPEDTDGMIAFDLATRTGDICDSNLPDLLHHLRGLQWAIEAGCDWVSFDFTPGVLPKFAAVTK